MWVVGPEIVIGLYITGHVVMCCVFSYVDVDGGV